MFCKNLRNFDQESNVRSKNHKSRFNIIFILPMFCICSRNVSRMEFRRFLLERPSRNIIYFMHGFNLQIHFYVHNKH